MIRKNDLRVWGVWDSCISRLEYLSQSQSDCRHIMELYRKVHRDGIQLLRFDLSPLYYDNVGSSDFLSHQSILSSSISATLPTNKTKQHKKESR